MLTVNVTSTFQRLELCRIALTSFLLQTRLPDQINLWLSEDAHLGDEGIKNTDAVDQLLDSLPEKNKHLIKVRWTTNIGPYRKLTPILREANSGDVIVTADDDIFYGKDWLSGLVKAYHDADGKLVAPRVRAKKVNFLGKKTSYLHWGLIGKSGAVRGNFIITFGGGAVITRDMFRDEDIEDDTFLRVAPMADDLWYSKLLQRSHNEVIVLPDLLNQLYPILHNHGLMNHNFPASSSFIQKIKNHIWSETMGFLGFSVCGNDIAYKKIARYFPETSDK